MYSADRETDHPQQTDPCLLRSKQVFLNIHLLKIRISVMLTFYDNHIHRFYGESDSAAVFYDKARKAGSLGGNIFSLPPKSFDPA